MSLRLRFALLAAGAVAVAIVTASAVMYAGARQHLLAQTDQVLAARAAPVFSFGARSLQALRQPIPPARRATSDVEPPGSRPEIFFQVVRSDGEVVRRAAREGPFPVDERTLAVAQGDAAAFYSDTDFAGSRWRLYTVPLEDRYAVQLAQPVDEIDAILRDLARTSLIVIVGGVLLAGVLGAAVAQTAIRPIDALTRAVEDLARTRDLSRRVPVGGDDEMGRLADSFNSMLVALDASLRSQRQLVADASHELRTPITSLRTNVELLARGQPADPAERGALVRDVVGQAERLGHLVAELIDLAREEEQTAPVAFAEVALDQVVRGAVAVAAQQWPSVSFELSAEPSTVRADPARIERAVRNLLDNAAKWSPPQGRIEVTVRDGEVGVRDHGPGVAEADAPHVFDRFWRAPAARSLPGSGLGLAIVKEVARVHAGKVWVERASGGGALFRLRLPLAGEGGAA